MIIPAVKDSLTTHNPGSCRTNLTLTDNKSPISIMETTDTKEIIQEMRDILQARFVEREIARPTLTTPDLPNRINPFSICLWKNNRKNKTEETNYE